MVEGAGVAVRVGLAGRGAEAGGAADDRLVQPPPGPVRAEPVGPHEGLVCEAGADQRREDVVDRSKVEAERGPAVLAHRDEAVAKLDLGRAHVRREAPGAARDADERIRLLGAGRDDPARAVIFIGPAHELHAVGEKGGRERVALVAGVGDAVESEGDRPRAVNRGAAGRRAMGLRHDRPPAGISGRGAPGW